MNLTFKKKIFIIFVFLGLGYYFLIIPNLEEINEKENELKSLQKEFYHQGTLMQEQEKKKEMYKEKIEKLSKREISSLDYENSNHRNKLFIDLNDFSDNFDVDLEYINPAGEEETEGFIKQNFNLYLTGKHEEIFKYVAAITDLDYIVRIENFHLRLEDENRLELEIDLAHYLSK